MGTLNDKPATNKFPEGLIHESKAKQKLYLRKIASMVVGKNVIQNEQMESFLAKVLSIEGYQAEIAREQREDGRFVCRFPGCDKSFAFNGKRMRDHEAQRDSQVLETEASNTTEVRAQESQSETSKSSARDDMYNYQCSFLQFAMIIANFFDAIREGDGKCIVRCLEIHTSLFTTG